MKSFTDEKLAAVKALAISTSRLSKHISDTLRGNQGARTAGGRAKAKAAAAHASGSAGAAFSSVTTRVFQADLSIRHTEIQMMPADTVANVSSCDIPWYIQRSAASQRAFEDGHVRLNHIVFKAAFVKDKGLKRDMKNLLNAQHAHTGVINALFTSEAVGRLAAEEILKEAHVFGCKGDSRSYGPYIFAAGGACA